MEGQVLCFAISTVISGHLRENMHGRTKRRRWQWEEQEDFCDARSQSRLAAGETSRVGTSHLREDSLQDYFSSSCLFVCLFCLSLLSHPGSCIHWSWAVMTGCVGAAVRSHRPARGGCETQRLVLGCDVHLVRPWRRRLPLRR